MGYAEDLKGQRFGEVIVLGRAPNIRNGARWIVQCDCGRRFNASSHRLRHGLTQYCIDCSYKKRGKKYARYLPKFCTYLYYDEDKTPRYVGSGLKRRPYQGKNRKTFPKPTNDEFILILKRFDSKEEAELHEEYMIDVIGTEIDGTGPLKNISPGRNRNHPTTSQKHSQKMTGTKQTPERIRHRAIKNSKYVYKITHPCGLVEDVQLLREFAVQQDLSLKDLLSAVKRKCPNFQGFKIQRLPKPSTP